MRHRIAGYRLSRSKSARIALRRNLIKQLFVHERIRTTKTKAAAVRGEAEKMITLAKNVKDSSDTEKIQARRLVAAKLGDNKVLAKLFDEIAPRFENRTGGYTRVMKLGPRSSDSAEMVLLELVED